MSRLAGWMVVVAALTATLGCTERPSAKDALAFFEDVHPKHDMACRDLGVVGNYAKGTHVRYFVVRGMCHPTVVVRAEREFFFEIEYVRYPDRWKPVRFRELDAWTGGPPADRRPLEFPERSRIDRGQLLWVGIPAARVVLALILRFVGTQRSAVPSFPRRFKFPRRWRPPHQQRSHYSTSRIDDGTDE